MSWRSVLGAGGLAVASPGFAAVPGTSLVAPACDSDPSSACWDHAAELVRFAPAPGMLVDPIHSARVRLAWSSDGLLVRIDALPDASRLELGLARKAGETRLSHAEPGVFSEPGIHLLAPQRPLTAGEVRHIWVTVATSVDPGVVVRPWSPAGPADPDHPPRVLFVEASGLGLPLELSRSKSSWQLTAVAGDEVHVAHLRPSIAGASSTVPDPWRVVGQGELSTDAPSDWGWMEAAAVWRDANGAVVDLQSVRAWSEPAGPVGVSGDALFFPPVKQLESRTGSWRLDSSPVVCGAESLSGAGELLVRELVRVTGHAARWSTRDTDCAVHLNVVDASADMPPDGFVLDVSRTGARVEAGARLGLVYGGLALVDALGPDARMPQLRAVDWPTVTTRPLYHSINYRGRPDLTVTDLTTFIERTVLRGRYNQLHVLLSDGIASPSAPELPHARHLSVLDVATIRELADDVGLELIPAVNAPAHSAWMLRSHPELGEDVHPSLLDFRHPGTAPLLDAHYGDVVAAFGAPSALHIGHDEVLWQSRRWFGDERNPRTSSTPRSILLADDLRWHLDWCRARGLTPYMWTDMLLADWNGGREGTHRALDLLTDAERRELRAMAWSPLGDPFDALQRKHGIPVMRVHTAYVDWKRAGLVDQLATDAPPAGEGLALFLPAPWAAFGPSAGSRNLHYHLGSVVLAGATAWEPSLEPQSRIRPTLAALAGHPVLRPGYVALPHSKVTSLVPQGPKDSRESDIAWPDQIKSDDLRVAVHPRTLTSTRPEVWPVGQEATGTALFMAVRIRHSAEAKLRHAVNRHADAEHQAIGWVVLRYADGTLRKRPLEYGEDIYAIDADPRANSMWRSADVVPMASAVVASDSPEGRDLRLYRVDVPADPTSELVEVRVENVADGVELVVGAVAVFVP